MKNFRLHLTLLMVLLCMGIGLSIFIYKLQNGFPLFPEEKVNSWHVELKIHVKNAPKNLQITAALPLEKGNLKVIDSQIIDNGFGDYIGEYQDGGFILWSKRHPEKNEYLYYRAVVYQVKSADTIHNETYQQIPRQDVSSALDDPLSQNMLENITKSLKQESATDYNFITGLQKMIRQGTHPGIKYLQAKLGNADLVTVTKEILNYASIPARIMNGVLLSSSKKDAEFVRWIEAYTKDKMISFDPMRKNLKMPSNLLPWWVGDTGMLVSNHKKSQISKQIAIKRHTESALTEAIWNGDNQVKSMLYGLTMYILPVELQVVMRILLLIPLGAWVCIAIKQIIGIKTLGTFMPVLLALAFRETSLVNGLALFTLLITIGIIFRGLFDKMHLLTVPRLGAILSVIVLCIFSMALILNHFGIQASGISLFPLVILTMMIERISVSWDELGSRETLMTLISSLGVTTICYQVIIHPEVEHLFITFPELLLVVTALMLLVGRYNGYKLSEYFRFKAMKL